MPIRTALVSVSDKTVSSRSRARSSSAACHPLERRNRASARGEGIPVETVESYTGSPEVMDGRVKTLHPRVHGGILSRGERDKADLERLGARDRSRRRQPLSVRASRGRPGLVARGHRREHRHRRAVDGALGREEPRARRGRVRSRRLRSRARRDRATEATPHPRRAPSSRRRRSRTPPRTTRPSAGTCRRAGPRGRGRAFRGTSRCPSSAPTGFVTARTRTRRRVLRRARRARRLARASREPRRGRQGALLQQSRRRGRGARRGARVRQAGRGRREAHESVRRRRRGRRSRRRTARRARPTRVSAFGGIVALNREVDEATAKVLAETFLECVVAPSFAAAALEVLRAKKNLRLLATGAWLAADHAALSTSASAAASSCRTATRRRRAR